MSEQIAVRIPDGLAESLEELVAIHTRVVEADRALKSGASGDVVLPVLIGRIAGEPARV